MAHPNPASGASTPRPSLTGTHFVTSSPGDNATAAGLHDVPVSGHLPGLPFIGTKLPYDVIGKFTDDPAELQMFIERLEDTKRDMDWSDAVAGRAAKLCLRGRAYDLVSQVLHTTCDFGWASIKSALQQEFYGSAIRNAAEVRLDTIQRNNGEAIAAYSDRIRRLAGVAFYDRTWDFVQERMASQFLRGLGNFELRVHLREKHECLKGIKFRQLVAEASSWRLDRINCPVRFVSFWTPSSRPLHVQQLQSRVYPLANRIKVWA